jgi:hypothetical protein
MCLVKDKSSYKPIIIPASEFMESHDKKDKLRKILLEMNSSLEILSTIIVSEAWVSKDMEFANKGLANDPKKEEVVMVSISNIFEENLKIFIIDRTGKIPVLVKNLILDDPKTKVIGRFTGLTDKPNKN